MKSLVKAVAITAVVALPVLSFAQSNEPVARAEVRQDLMQVESAGYNPAADDRTTYPEKAQAAEQQLHPQSGQMQQGYGGSNSGSSAAGMGARPMPRDGTKPIYFGH